MGAGKGTCRFGIQSHWTFLHRLDRPSRVRFTDPTGNILFEHSAAPTQDGLVR